MPGAWYIHDAGFFTLELPPGWMAEQPNTGTLLIQDPGTELALSLLAIAKVPPGTSQKTRTVPLEAQVELQKWLETQRHVQVRQAPRVMAGTPYATATTEGLQHLKSRHSWWKRLLLRLRGMAGGSMLWRFWAVLNPHLLVLVSCNGKPATLEKQRALVDRLVASIHLPEREILIGRQFTETVVSLARTWFPQMAVSLLDDAHLQFGSQNLSLAGLHRRYLASPEELPLQVRAFLAAVQVNMPASALAGSWKHAGARIMPVFLTPRLLAAEAKNHVVHEEWINGLAIGYALEEEPPRAPGEDESAEAQSTPEPAQRIILHEDLMRWKISAEELHAQAMQNLIVYSHQHIMEGRREEGLTMLCLASPDRHNAARILLPELHQKLREHLGTTFLAALPTREVLIAFNISDAKVMEQVREHVAQDFADSEHALSPKLFLVTPDGIAGDPEDVEDLDL